MKLRLCSVTVAVIRLQCALIGDNLLHAVVVTATFQHYRLYMWLCCNQVRACGQMYLLATHAC